MARDLIGEDFRKMALFLHKDTNGNVFRAQQWPESLSSGCWKLTQRLTFFISASCGMHLFLGSKRRCICFCHSGQLDIQAILIHFHAFVVNQMWHSPVQVCVLTRQSRTDVPLLILICCFIFSRQGSGLVMLSPWNICASALFWKYNQHYLVVLLLIHLNQISILSSIIIQTVRHMKIFSNPQLHPGQPAALVHCVCMFTYGWGRCTEEIPFRD